MYSIKHQQPQELPDRVLVTVISPEGKVLFTTASWVVLKKSSSWPVLPLLIDHQFLPGFRDGRVCHEAAQHQAKT